MVQSAAGTSIETKTDRHLHRHGDRLGVFSRGGESPLLPGLKRIPIKPGFERLQELHIATTPLALIAAASGIVPLIFALTRDRGRTQATPALCRCLGASTRRDRTTQSDPQNEDEPLLPAAGARTPSACCCPTAPAATDSMQDRKATARSVTVPPAGHDHDARIVN